MTLERLLGWRAELESHIAAVEGQIQPLQVELEKARQQMDLVTRLIRLQQGETSVEPVSATRPAPHAAGESEGTVADVIAGILEQEGGALHISEIRSRFIDTGRAVPGQGTDSNLIAYITRSSRFVRVAKGTYALASAGQSSGSRPTRARRKRRRRGRSSK